MTFTSHTSGVFITGTDTNIGKTLVSSLLTKAWDACYWKPFQTGTETGDDDSKTVQYLSQCPSHRILTPAYSFQAPLAPYPAALSEKRSINLETLTYPQPPHEPLIVEGAGGLMVPITKNVFMIDFIQRLSLPTILVTRSNLGTLNHTLLSLEALYSRNIPVLGVITSGKKNMENIQLIEQLGRTRCLFHFPSLQHAPMPSDIEKLSYQFPPLSYFSSLH